MSRVVAAGRGIVNDPFALDAPAADMEAALRRHVLQPWFSRCLDREHGGFLCDFDRVWRPCGPHDKMLEFQARQTRLAACAARAYPAEASHTEAALHGFRFLRDVMWDRVSGGWFRMVDRTGAPMEAATKHAHGIAYAIGACGAVHEATGDPSALELAQRGFEWLDHCAHDDVHGGYHGFLRRDGTPITDSCQSPLVGVETDPIGTPVGFKDVNVHSDLIETFTDLGRVWEHAPLRQRLAEVLAIVRDRMIVANGAMHAYFLADWTPVPDLARYGFAIQTARRLAQAQRALGTTDEAVTRRVVRLLVRHTLAHAWDPTVGGIASAGSAFGPITLEGRAIVVRSKFWWVQAEALRTLLYMAVHDPEPAVDYVDYFRRQWRYVQKHFFDRVHGGWNEIGRDGVPWWRLLVRAGQARKGHVWKDASHEGLALMHCVRMLRGLPEDAPL